MSHNAQSVPPVTRPDLSSCEQEQIQFLGAVQPFGHLVVITNDWVIQNVSENVGTVLGVEPMSLIGQRLIEVLPSQAVHDLRGKVQTMASAEGSVRVFDVDLFDDGRRFDVNLHRAGAQYLMEFECKTTEKRRDELAMIQPLIDRVRKETTIDRMCRVAARGVQALTGFSRVMIYQFDEEFAGHVIAESTARGQGSFLGLRFPAADIPPQARALYKRSLLRIIPDVDAQVSRVVPTTTPSGDPLDLSMAVTRAVSPIHLQYLRNMEVRASMSSSILREGELWGLIACHHDTPRHIDFQTRSALELFTQLLAYELAHRQDRNEMKEAEKAHLLHDRLVMMFEGGMDLGNSLRLLGEEIGEVIPFDGIASFSGDRYRCEGLTPTAEELDVLRKHLARMPSNRAYSTGFVEKAFPGAIAPDRGIGGMMALPIKREPREYVLLFRQEIVHSVNWAGDPSKPAQVVDGRLTPRESFAIWKEDVRGKSAPWTAGEKRSGEILRVTLLELMLKMTTQVATRGRQRSDKQEILIAELNHRLRNIFTVMGGMVRQASATDGESLRQSLSRRIETLARANDALIAGGAETASLRGLIADEIGAFDSGSRLRVEGQDAQISGPARGTLALVIHELVTNSFKYGALSVPEGQIVLALSNGPNGSLIWTWKERGGPKVEEPSRTGFGTTLISRAIPHELRGEAEIAFKPGGVEARFVLPATAAKMSSFAPSLKVVETMPDDANLLKDQEVLVVDDNFVIAMNASDALERLGPRKVHLAGGVEEGLKLLKAQTVDFAVLDIDLGGESSEPIAQRLTEMGVPFILASGYSAKDDLGASFTGHPVLTKPYSNENLASAIKAMRLNS